jgi:hypothetical protein
VRAPRTRSRRNSANAFEELNVRTYVTLDASSAKSRRKDRLDDTDEMDEDEDRDDDWREPGSPNRRINIG